jgi:hypothetical protein
VNVCVSVRVSEKERETVELAKCTATVQMGLEELCFVKVSNFLYIFCVFFLNIYIRFLLI